jgi:hypothetical protein
MNLANLRRLVVLGNVVALGAAGYAGWESFGTRPSPRAKEEWPKLFPVKQAAAEPDKAGPGPKDEYTAASGWPQGDKPVKAPEGPPPPPPPPPDPLQGISLRVAFINGTYPVETYGLFSKGDRCFAMAVGEYLPKDPGNARTRREVTEWRLDDIRLGGPDPKGEKILPTVAVFHGPAGKEIAKEAMTHSEKDLPSKAADTGGLPGEFATRQPGQKPPRDQPPRAVRVKFDPAKGEYEWAIHEDEGEWLDAWSDDEAAKIAAVPSKDAEGRPDGFVLKAVPAGSRAATYGFEAEDKVISVNGEAVASVEDAVAKGKRQHEAGSSTFIVKAIRKGKEVNYTFHAPRKKVRQ